MAQFIDEASDWDEETLEALDKILEDSETFKKFPILSTQEGKNLFYEIYKRVKEKK